MKEAVNEIKNGINRESITKTKNGFFEKINKSSKSLARLTKKERRQIY